MTTVCVLPICAASATLAVAPRIQLGCGHWKVWSCSWAVEWQELGVRNRYHLGSRGWLCLRDLQQVLQHAH